MSRLQELIAKLCPDGVEYKALGEIGKFYGGLTGKSKKDFGVGAKFVTYNNAYGNAAVNLDEYGLVQIDPDEKQNTVELGDVIFTISSENREEAGMTSVMTVDPGEPWYLNSFCTGWRLLDKSMMLPDFLKHLLRGPEAREAISKTANGVTRFNISKPRLAKVRIPVPAIEVQREVVRILDKYTGAHDELVRQLEEEAACRAASLISLCNHEICQSVFARRPIHEIGQLERGRRFTAADYVDDGIPSIHYGEVYTEYGVSTTETVSTVRSDMAANLRYAHPGDVVIACTGENKNDICKAVAWLGDADAAVHDDCQILHHDSDPRYIAYALMTSEFHDQKVRAASESKVVRVSSKKLGNMLIPLPSKEQQQAIANRLDEAFRAVDSLISLLEKERSDLEQQLALVRNQLLSFPEKVA